jgi:hypothetical protein
MSSQPNIRTMMVEVWSAGRDRIWKTIPDTIPENRPRPIAHFSDFCALRKLSLRRVGLLSNTSVSIMPTDKEMATQGNKIISGNCFSNPISVKITCPIFQPHKADMSPLIKYNHVLINLFIYLDQYPEELPVVTYSLFTFCSSLASIFWVDY